ncbi:MAG: hypothetical protein A2X35_09735 [Elusimicrobia bacterium GWA2_61_42]|nr:MAG: hypothetical protein A2X35_09735 [Elusimicrobia bacterium GWA2_61_42]OGR76449.1 MAG: hypothetical protein A2X38_12270 [Elusimicrobia bacterium GWC2_61_25]
MIKLTLMSLFFCALSASAAGAPYTCEGGYFSIAIPAGWTQTPPGGQPASAKKIYGVDLLAAAQGKSPAPSITVKFFAKGNTLFKTPDIYVQLNSRPIGDAAEGERYSDVTAARVAGKKAHSFERKYFEFSKPRTVPAEKTAMFERHLVVPAGGGFYLLMFSVPFNNAKALLPQFDAVVKSFRPKY